jgi:hypothetical protein
VNAAQEDVLRKDDLITYAWVSYLLSMRYWLTSCS